ncbi:hypothetical protein ACFQ3B_19050 [Stackebrandtia endophytica]|nr:hypothetical protein [Stackebrandtia endophytica]
MGLADHNDDSGDVMEYRINFDSQTDIADLAGCLRARFEVEESLIYVGAPVGLGDYPGPAPMVVISPARDGERYGCQLQAGPRLAEQVDGIAVSELAGLLCVDAATSALVPGGRTGWRLVTSDGHVTEVIIDEELLDQEGFVIVAALRAIPLMPEVPVRSGDWHRERFNG